MTKAVNAQQALCHKEGKFLVKSCIHPIGLDLETQILIQIQLQIQLEMIETNTTTNDNTNTNPKCQNYTQLGQTWLRSVSSQHRNTNEKYKYHKRQYKSNSKV